mmetsp:Transcript_14978/g.40324  ORF Transcript_14978/g.40324 Transcript_14978/m.40324 type:complete len:294 (+) Transcript_14978:76-957(+)
MAVVALDEENVVSAIQTGDISAVIAWCQRLGPQAVTLPLTSGTTLLHLAAEAGNVRLADMFLQQGASPAALDADGQNPLHHACLNGHLKVVRTILGSQAGCTPEVVNQRDNYLVTPLHLAIEEGHTTIVATLLALPEQDRRTKRHSALVLAERHGRRKVAQLLRDGEYTNVMDMPDPTVPPRKTPPRESEASFKAASEGGAAPKGKHPAGDSRHASHTGIAHRLVNWRPIASFRERFARHGGRASAKASGGGGNHRKAGAPKGNGAHRQAHSPPGRGGADRDPSNGRIQKPQR